MNKFIKLINVFMDWEHRGKDTLCVDTLAKFFDIPKDTCVIYAKLSKRKTKNAYKVLRVVTRQRRHGMGTDPYIVFEDKNGNELKEEIYTHTVTLLEAFKMPCYVSIEY